MSNKPVAIQAEAEADINDAYQWYESQRKGLGGCRTQGKSTAKKAFWPGPDP